MTSTAIQYQPRNRIGSQGMNDLLRSDVTDCNDLYKRVLVLPLKRFSDGYMSAVSRAKTTHENPNRSMRRLAREMHKAGYTLADFMLLLTDLVCFAKAQWKQDTVTHAMLVSASMRETAAEGATNMLQAAIHNPNVSDDELRACRLAAMAERAALDAFVTDINLTLRERLGK